MQPLLDEIRNHLPFDGEARRLFHGRGHAFSGYNDLVIDCYPPVILVNLYAERPEEWLAELCRGLREQMVTAEAILLQERFRPGSPSRLLYGALPTEINAREEGLDYRLRLGEAQNVGFFPDMRVGRQFIREHATGKHLLNLFSYSCSFSVAALAGGAARVVNLDMNRGALELGRLNHQINGIDLRKTSFLSLELFRSFSKLRKIGPFDLVICDPPATQGKSFTAEQHWPKLLRKLPELLCPDGEILACLNAPHLTPAWLDGLFAELLPQATKRDELSPGEDFPEAVPDRGVSIHHYVMGGE